jgi:hydroxyethylthiazole kinase-like uncharacterized protein yjeF
VDNIPYPKLILSLSNHFMTATLSTGKTITTEQVHALFAARDPLANKGTFGAAAILGGAAGMTGAALLAARAALKTGAGKVFVGLAQHPSPVSFDCQYPELMLRAVPDLLAQAAGMQAWAVGCGLGQSEQAIGWLRQLFLFRQSVPLVVDADGLNALACGAASPTWGRGDVVLTPHPAEAGRLLGISTEQVQADRPVAAQSLARQYKAWVVLKGAGSIVCAPDRSWQINLTGNVGLATGGTGDVLSGILVSLLAQGIPTHMAIPAGVWLHGSAADRLVERGIGPIGLTAGELADAARDIRNQRSL